MWLAWRVEIASFLTYTPIPASGRGTELPRFSLSAILMTLGFQSFLRFYASHMSTTAIGFVLSFPVLAEDGVDTSATLADIPDK